MTATASTERLLPPSCTRPNRPVQQVGAAAGAVTFETPAGSQTRRILGLQPGTLVFAKRLNRAQALNSVVGDWWTHVGILVWADSCWQVVESVPGEGCRTRTLSAWLSTYAVTGFGVPTAHRLCLDRMARWSIERVSGDGSEPQPVYAWDRVAFVAAANLLRGLVPRAREAGLVARLRQASAVLGERGAPHKLFCSSLVVRAFDVLCPQCRPTLRWPTRPRRRALSGSSVLDPFLCATVASSEAPTDVAALLTPTDLWASSLFAVRVIVESGRASLARPVDAATTLTLELSDAGDLVLPVLDLREEVNA